MVPLLQCPYSKRLYVFDPANSPKELHGRLAGKTREGLITSNWSDKLRIAATMTAGTIAPAKFCVNLRPILARMTWPLPCVK